MVGGRYAPPVASVPSARAAKTASRALPVPFRIDLRLFFTVVLVAAVIVLATPHPSCSAPPFDYAFASAPPGPVSGDYGVVWVIDGDTVVIRGGGKVRYIGIDTPEKGEPLYEDARRRNISLVGGRTVRLEFCGPEPTDRYGRLLAWVYAEGELVNLTLVREGLARALIIPPCGTVRAGEIRAAERAAREEGLGIWGVGARQGGDDVAED